MINLIIVFAIGFLSYDIGTKKEVVKLEQFKTEVAQCLDYQVDLFNDLCAEWTTGYEDKPGVEAYYDGVVCGVKSASYCIEIDIKTDGL